MQSILIAMAVTVVISILGAIFAPDILRLMGAAPEVIKEGTTFARIMLGGSIVIILLFLINGIFRGAGDAAMAMRSLWIASIINIFLCPMLIYGYGPFPELGIERCGNCYNDRQGHWRNYINAIIYSGGKRIIHIKRSHFKWIFR